MHHSISTRLRVAAIVAALASTTVITVAVTPAAAAQAPTSCVNAAVVNGSFETPVIAANNFAQVDESVVPGWDTTATDNRIEIWRTPFQSIPVPAGSQFVEINATQRSKLYQDIATTPGETIRWQVQHRGRTGVDTMEVRLGAPGAVLALQTTIANGQTWRTYSGLYTVPAGQTTTRLSFDSISSANGNPSYGNFVDAVSITSGACVVTTKSVVNLSGDDVVRLGDTLQYSIVASNQGASAASVSSVIDAIPAGLSLVPGSITVASGATTTPVTDVPADDAGEYDAASREVRVRVGSGASSVLGGTLAAGSSATVSFRVLVDSVDALPSVNNTASVAFTDALSSLSRVSTSNTTTTTITPDAPALSIVTSGTVTPTENQAAANAGDTITWSYLVSNTGNVPLTDVTVIDPEGGTITCVPTEVAVGESATCTGTATHTVTYDDLGTGSVSNGATARATPPFGASPVDALESVATITTVAIAPAIAVSVAHDNLTNAEPGAPILAGDELRARFVVTNTGNATLNEIVVIDPVFGAVTCLEVTLAPGASTNCVADVPYTVTEADAAAESISRTISATGVAASGGVSTSVSDDQLVTLPIDLDLPTFPFPPPAPPAPVPPVSSPELPTLAATGTDIEQSMTLALALALVGAGVAALAATRLNAVRKGRRGAATN